MKRMNEKAMRRVNGGLWLFDWLKGLQAKRRWQYDTLMEAAGL